MIELQNVEKTYKTGSTTTWVLRRIDHTIAEGDFVTIMGPSGAGKSTLLNILGMLDTNFGGEYTFLGHSVGRLKSKDRAKLSRENVGFVFQDFHLLDDLTVSENLEVPLSYRNVKAAEPSALVADALDRFQIVGKKDLYPSQLSGGQQQLVGVARAVIGRPKLLLADEPTGNLHSKQGREVMNLFKQLNSDGATIIQVTHSAENAAFGRRVIELRDGWMENDTTREHVPAI